LPRAACRAGSFAGLRGTGFFAVLLGRFGWLSFTIHDIASLCKSLGSHFRLSSRFCEATSVRCSPLRASQKGNAPARTKELFGQAFQYLAQQTFYVSHVMF